ncbi:MAG: hypothetical protein CSA66_06555 [Proteobacteria bacterium]|nr:MAG: hypothetical protein CSA66_06555 [Pseudomonadota bacterium]
MMSLLNRITDAITGGTRATEPSGRAVGRRAGAPVAKRREPEPPLAAGSVATRYGYARALVMPQIAGEVSKDAVVKAALSRGIFSDAGQLRLTEPVTRAEAVVMTMRAFNHQPLNAGAVKRVLKDMPISHWAAGHVYQAMVLGIVGGYPDETFRPNDGFEAAYIGPVVAAAASPSGQPKSFDPRVEWGARPTMEGGKLGGAANARSLDVAALGGERDATGGKDVRVKDANRIVDTLEAGKSKRYQPGDGKTFCNIFAHDYAYLMGAFVPRLWWTGAAIDQYKKTGEFPAVKYGENTYEMGANGLHKWFSEWGPKFGWTYVGGVRDPAALRMAQDQANAGRVVIVTGNTASRRSGHITAVVPETETSKAKRDEDGGIEELHQSQAGAEPVTRGADDWYLAAKYKGGQGIWLHS